jgi:hypothetical protein
MKDSDDAIPVGMISVCDAFDTVYQTITPDRKTLEERLDPNSPYFDAFKGAKKRAKKGAKKSGRKSLKKGLEKDPEKNPKKDAKRGAWRNYYQAQLHASKVLREKLSQGVLVARFGEKKEEAEEIGSDRWALMSDFDAMLIFNEGKAIVRGKRRILYFDRENFMKKITPPDGDRAAHAGESAPTAPKARSKLQARSWMRHQRMREIDNQLRLEGFDGLQKERYAEIRSKFSKDKPSDRTIIRALTSPKSD